MQDDGLSADIKISRTDSTREHRSDEIDESQFVDNAEEDDPGIGGLSHDVDMTDGRETGLEKSSFDGSAGETTFSAWAQRNRKWIDVYLRHGLEYAVMGDILNTAELGYKSWKTSLP